MEEKKVNGEMLYLANDKVFRDLGIPSIFQVAIKLKLSEIITGPVYM